MRKRGGFTLIELLVVIGIIVALIAILLPAVHRAYMVAEKAAIASDLQVIANALDAYRADFGAYPMPGTITEPHVNQGQPIFINGQKILCWALVAPGPASEDGADGPGFRLRGTTGRVRGPYLPPDRFVVGTMGGNPGDTAGVISCADAGKPPSDWFDVLADRRGRVILYYPAHVAAHPSNLPGSYVGPPPPGSAVQPMWDAGDDEQPQLPLMEAYDLRNLLGAARDGGVLPGGIPITAPFLLISAGTADAVAQPTGSGPQSQQSAVPDSFGVADNVANVPLSPRFPIPDPIKN